MYKLVIGCVVLLLIGFFVGIIRLTDYTLVKDIQKEHMAGKWAYGTAEDAIRIIQTIRADPKRTDAKSVYEGPNASSWYFDTLLTVRFRGVYLVYSSYKEYLKAKRWLKKNPEIMAEPSQQPTW